MKTRLTLDCVVRLHLCCPPDGLPHSHPDSHFPSHAFPKLQSVTLCFDGQDCLLQLLSSAQPLLASLYPQHINFLPFFPIGFFGIPHDLWTSVASSCSDLWHVTYSHGCVLRLESEGEYQMLSWKVEMASDWELIVDFDLSYPGDLERVERLQDGKDFISVLEEDLAIFECSPSPRPEIVCV
jgi:hypothetical protein